MHEELIKNIRNLKQKLAVGLITTLDRTDHRFMNQLDFMEDLVNKDLRGENNLEQSKQLVNDHNTTPKNPSPDVDYCVCTKCGKHAKSTKMGNISKILNHLFK